MVLGGGLGLTAAALDGARKLGGGVDGRHVAAGLECSRGRVWQGEITSGVGGMKAEDFFDSRARATVPSDHDPGDPVVPFQ